MRGCRKWRSVCAPGLKLTRGWVTAEPAEWRSSALSGRRVGPWYWTRCREGKMVHRVKARYKENSDEQCQQARALCEEWKQCYLPALNILYLEWVTWTPSPRPLGRYIPNRRCHLGQRPVPTFALTLITFTVQHLRPVPLCSLLSEPPLGLSLPFSRVHNK